MSGNGMEFLLEGFPAVGFPSFRGILDHHALFTATDPDGRIIRASRKFHELSGYDADEIAGRTHAFLKSDMHDEAFWRDLWDTVSSGRIWQGVICNRARNGHLFWLYSTIGPMLDDEGRHRGYLALYSDITREKLAEAVLTGERELIGALREGVPFDEAIGDFLGRMERLVPELRLSVLEHRDDGRLYHVAAPRLPEVYTNAVDGVSAGPGVGSCGEAAATAKPVIVADISTHANWADYPELVAMLGGGACWSWPVPGDEGRALGTVAAYADSCREPSGNECFLLESLATSLASAFLMRATREAQERSMARERELTEKQQSLLRRLAHELRTPLNHVLGFAGLLVDRLSDPELRDWAKSIEAGGRALFAKVRSCEDILKPSVGTDAVSVDVAACMRDAVRRWLEEHPRRVSPTVEAPPDLVVAMEREDLERMLEHLLDNVARFTDAECAVRLRAAECGEEVVLEVMDEGPGVDAELADDLGELFLAAGGGPTDVSGGLGLGLAAVRHLAHRNGGSVAIDTAPGRGFRVIIRLPRADGKGGEDGSDEERASRDRRDASAGPCDDRARCVPSS